VVQETFLAAFRSIEKVEPRPSLSPWLNTIVLRTAGRAASRRRSRPGPSLDQSVRHHPGSEAVAGPSLGEGMIDSDPSGDPHAAAEAAELRRDLAAALIDLPFKYRAAVVLRHVMGLDYAEAALQMDVPLNTFKSHLLRGTRMLREALAGRLEPPDAATRARTTPMVPADGHGLGSGNGRRPGELVVGSEQPIRR
jgi:RNA polymerase sigma-70 factor (ECF subfamily)